MERGLVRINPSKERAKSILSTVDSTLSMVGQIDLHQFPTNLTKEYYDVIRELIGAVLLLDGYKTVGGGSHRRLIKYLGDNYKQFDSDELILMNSLRRTRNRISYEGFKVREDYLKRKMAIIQIIIDKLKEIIKEKLN